MEKYKGNIHKNSRLAAKGRARLHTRLEHHNEVMKKGPKIVNFSMTNAIYTAGRVGQGQ